MTLIKRIGIFIAKINPAFKRFMRQFEMQAVQRALDLALHVTTTIKTFLHDPGTIKVIELTQTDVDNRLRDAMVKSINANIQHLLGAKACASITDPNERLACYMANLKAMVKDDSNDELRRLAVAVAKDLAAEMKAIIESRNFWNLAVEFYLWLKKTV